MTTGLRASAISNDTDQPAQLQSVKIQTMLHIHTACSVAALVRLKCYLNIVVLWVLYHVQMHFNYLHLFQTTCEHI